MKNIDIDDVDQVKEYIKKNILYPKLKKHNGFYIFISKLYDKYPNTTKEIIDVLPKITYYKDYLKILNLSDNNELNSYIYDVMLRQINKDIDDSKKNLPISTLAKWLPRKGREFDRKLDFVNKFGKMMFGDISKIKIYIKYRKTVADLTKKINPIELNLCSKNIEGIKKNNITIKNHTTYNKKYHNNDILQNVFIENMNDYVNSKKPIDLINRMMNICATVEEKNVNEINAIEKKWANSDVKKITDDLNVDISKYIIVFDISSHLYNTMKKYIIMLATLCIYVNGYFVINKKNPEVLYKKNTTLSDNINNIVENLSVSLNIDVSKLDKCIEKNNLKHSKLLIITDKNINILENKILEHQNVEFIYLNTDKYSKICDRIHSGNIINSGNKRKEYLINQILCKSKELYTPTTTDNMIQYLFAIGILIMAVSLFIIVRNI